MKKCLGELLKQRPRMQNDLLSWAKEAPAGLPWSGKRKNGKVDRAYR